ncbi:MAG: hypothetical protein LIQ30_07555 [Planctomycetes bacterium]|nr:hypothetical protein [Planctomycetota bacterium]
MAVSSAGASDPYFIQRQVAKQATTLNKQKAAVLSVTSSLRTDKYDKYKRLARPVAEKPVDTYTPSSGYITRQTITKTAFTTYQNRKD